MQNLVALFLKAQEDNAAQRKEVSKSGTDNEKENGSGKAPARTKRILTAQLNPEDLKCQDCGESFPVMYKLKVILTRNWMNMLIWFYWCIQFIFQLHRLIHSETYPFSCQICDKGFNNKYKMKVHEKQHEARGDSRESVRAQKEREESLATQVEINLSGP